MTNKPFSKVVMLVLMFVATILSNTIASNADSKGREFKIGAVLPLTGAMAFAGSEVRDAISLALSEIGTTRHTYKVIFEDNGSGPVATASATNKLITQEGVDAIMTLWPETANVAAPITERQGVLHYTIAWDPLIACTHKLVLSHQVMVNDYARKTLELLKSHDVRSLDFYHDSVFQQGAELLARYAAEYGVTLRRVYVFDRGKTDFRSELTSSPRTQNILIWSIMPETEIFLRQVRELHKTGFVSGFFDVVQDYSLIEGFPFASEVFATSDFQRRFERRYGRAAVMKGPNAYDIIGLLTAAIERSPVTNPTPSEIKSELTKVVNYSGAVGSVSIDKCGNSSYPIVIKEVRQGKLIEITE
jgi:hypothetical protein